MSAVVKATKVKPKADALDLSEEQRLAMHDYLADIVPVADVIYPDGDVETMHRGRKAARRIANGGADRLTLAECADVLALLRHCEPRKPLRSDSMTFVGFMGLMEAMEHSVRQTIAEAQS